MITFRDQFNYYSDHNVWWSFVTRHWRYFYAKSNMDEFSLNSLIISVKIEWIESTCFKTISIKYEEESLCIKWFGNEDFIELTAKTTSQEFADWVLTVFALNQ